MTEIVVQRGQTVDWLFSLTDNGVTIDITGGQWEVLEPLSKPTITIQVTDGPGGLSVLSIDKDQTKALSVGQKTIRSRLIFPDGKAIAHTPLNYTVE